MSSNINIRDAVRNAGMDYLDKKAKGISDVLNDSTDVELTQVDLLKLQQETAQYNNMVSLMTTISKNLFDTDKEVIRNA